MFRRFNFLKTSFGKFFLGEATGSGCPANDTDSSPEKIDKDTLGWLKVLSCCNTRRFRLVVFPRVVVAPWLLPLSFNFGGSWTIFKSADAIDSFWVSTIGLPTFKSSTMKCFWYFNGQFLTVVWLKIGLRTFDSNLTGSSWLGGGDLFTVFEMSYLLIAGGAIIFGSLLFSVISGFTKRSFASFCSFFAVLGDT